MVFLPSSRKGKNVFVCFSKGVLALSTEVEFFSPFWSAFGLQDVIFCSWMELLASISATKQKLERYQSQNLRILRFLNCYMYADNVVM